MQFKAINSSSPHIQLKFPSIPKQPHLISPFNFIKSKQCPQTQTPLVSHLSKHQTFLNSHKLHCISPSSELLGQVNDQESEIPITNGDDNNHVSPEKLEMGMEMEMEMVDEQPTSGKLANQGLWDQMVEIMKFSGPATGLWICGPLMSLIDTAVIGQGSSIELAALGPGTVLCDYVGFVFMFLSVATSNMVATSLARKDENQVQHQISILLFVGLVSGVLMLVLTKLLGAWALTAFVGPKNAHLVPAGNSYIQIRALAWPVILVGSVAQSASLGMKDSLGPLKALLIASTINFFGDIVLCTFLGFGIAGAAWATAVSQIVAAYTMIDALNRKGYNGYSMLIPSLNELQEIFALAAPVFITMASKVAFYTLMIYFATSMGTQIVAAHQVMGQVYAMCSVWGEPLSQTAQSFMPELLYGFDRNLEKARGLLKSLLIIGASVGLLLGILGTSVTWFFPNIFTPDPGVVGEMQKIWLHFFFVVAVTPCILPCEGTLMAGRDLKFISLSMSGCFALGALILMFVTNQGLGLVGCWSALVVFQSARFTLSLRRLLSPRGVLHSEDLDRFRVAKLKAA